MGFVLASICVEIQRISIPVVVVVEADVEFALEPTAFTAWTLYVYEVTPDNPVSFTDVVKPE